MKFRSFLSYLCMMMLCYVLAISTQFFVFLHPERASASTCNPAGNPTGAWVQSVGTYTIGDVVIFGPGCNQIQDGGPLTNSTFLVVSSGPFTFTTAHCAVDIIFEGNTYFSASIGSAASFGICQLRLRNGDVYTGAGSGRARNISLNGFGSFNLYPGQYLNLQSDGTNWNPSEPLRNDGLGFVWFATAPVQFFVDNGGSNGNDGLASGAGGAFQTMQHCSGAAYSLIYTKNYGSVVCSMTAGQTFSEAVVTFYQLPGGGTLIFNSATPGSRFNWNCLASLACWQFGDWALVGITDALLTPTNSSGFIFSGHNWGVLDVNTNVQVVGNSLNTTAFGCDFDTQFNINNGLTYSGVGGGSNFIFQGCPHANFNINGTLNGTATAFNRFANFSSGTTVIFQGNVSFTGSPTGSAMLVTGNSVVNNLSGQTPAGGVPTPTTGGQYCTSLC